jgi:hypothetical protein
VNLEQTLQEIVEWPARSCAWCASVLRRRRRLAIMARITTRLRAPLIGSTTTRTSSIVCTTTSTPEAGGRRARRIASSTADAARSRVGRSIESYRSLRPRVVCRGAKGTLGAVEPFQGQIHSVATDAIHHGSHLPAAKRSSRVCIHLAIRRGAQGRAEQSARAGSCDPRCAAPRRCHQSRLPAARSYGPSPGDLDRIGPAPVTRGLTVRSGGLRRRPPGSSPQAQVTT